MSDPLVSVLMPVYNGGKYLEESIDSILKQTYRDFEFVIVNDCSTDNSVKTIQSFQDKRIVLHSNAINLGQTKSLNVGLRAARGKYVVINDADDLSLPWRIERQLGFILSHPKYVAVGSSGFIMDHSGYIYRTFRKHTHLPYLYSGILSDTPMIHGSVLMDRKVILEQGGYNEDFKICQDYELWSSLIRKGLPIANIPDILVIVRHYKDSVSFRESEQQTFENGKTLCENIATLTKLKPSFAEAIRQRLFFITPEALKKEEFKKAETLFIKECRSLQGKLPFGADLVLTDPKDRLEKPYCKLALFEIANGRHKEARRISFAFLRQYGFKRIPFLLFLFSFLGQRISQKIPQMYRMWQERSARVQLFVHRIKCLQNGWDYKSII